MLAAAKLAVRVLRQCQFPPGSRRRAMTAVRTQCAVVQNKITPARDAKHGKQWKNWLAAPGSSWQLLEAPDSSWQLLAAEDAEKAGEAGKAAEVGQAGEAEEAGEQEKQQKQ